MKKGELKIGCKYCHYKFTILEKRKELANLIQDTFREALGFDASSVSDLIFQGIEDGLKLGENSLGGFAKSFGELMKEALMKSVTDGMQVKLSEGFLADYKAFMEDNILSTDERNSLQKTFYDVVKQAEIDSQNIKLITGQYLDQSSSKSSLTGAISGASEETVSLVAGQLMAIS